MLHSGQTAGWKTRMPCFCLGAAIMDCAGAGLIALCLGSPHNKMTALLTLLTVMLHNRSLRLRYPHVARSYSWLQTMQETVQVERQVRVASIFIWG